MAYPDTQLFIGGTWRDAGDGRTLGVENPATGKEIGRVAHATKADLDLALDAVQRGFETWRDYTPAARSRIMRKAAGLMRERAGDIARFNAVSFQRPGAINKIRQQRDAGTRGNEASHGFNRACAERDVGFGSEGHHQLAGIFFDFVDG